MQESRLMRFITSHISPSFKKGIIQEVCESVKSEILTIVSELIEKTKGGNIVMHTASVSGVTRSISGVVHEKFDTVLQLVSHNLPVFLSGKAGTGKNVICKQIAEALGLDFYFTNAVTQEYKLTGFIDANGIFHETQFYKAFKNGGLFFLDEIDASIPETLVVLNAAIANRYFDFPNGKIEAHPNFRIIAAGNTFGTGSDSVYTGRYQLDGASLDRFSIVEVGYSKTIEKSITGNNENLIDFCHAFRNATARNGIDCLFSYRALIAITSLESTKMDIKDILKICLTKGMCKDDIVTVVNSLKGRPALAVNPYTRALAKLSE